MTREKILEAAYQMAVRNGFNTLTRDSIAAEAEIAKGAINHHFGTVSVVRNEVMRIAIEREQLSIIAQGLATDDGIAKSAPLELRTRALTTLL